MATSTRLPARWSTRPLRNPGITPSNENVTGWPLLLSQDESNISPLRAFTPWYCTVTGASLAIVAPLPGSSTLTRVLSTAHGAGTSISGSVLGLPVTLMASRSFDTLIEGLVGAADGSSDPDGSGDP